MRIFYNFIAFWAIGENAIAAEAGMPQLNPEYWASQTLIIVVFTVLYLSISKFFIPKIKDNLDDREKRIKEDLSQASKFKEEAEMKK